MSWTNLSQVIVKQSYKSAVLTSEKILTSKAFSLLWT